MNRVKGTRGYHLRVNPTWKLVTIHKPTDSWQHLPRETPVSARGFFWVGPLPDLADAQQLAEDLALDRDYNVHRCSTCFRGT